MIRILSRGFVAKIGMLLPAWSEKMYRDPFDYPLRSLEEVKLEFEKHPIDHDARIELVHYKDKEGDLKKDIRDSVVKMWINMDSWNLTPKQKARLVFLLGPRYKGISQFKIVSRQYPTTDQNIQKCLDIIYELLMECKRAP